MFRAFRKDRYFFLHVPKTAGTSFRHMLYQVFPPHDVLPNEEDLRANGQMYLDLQQLLAIAPKRQARCRLLVGHLPFAASMLTGAPRQVLVMLRDPAERAVSELRQLKRFVHKDLSLTEILRVPGVMDRSVTNRQTRMLALGLIEDVTPDWETMIPGRSDLEAAKKNLAACAFVGLSERFDDSITLCERTFGFAFPKRDLVLNASPPVDDDLGEVLLQVRDAVHLDMELYAFAKQLFGARFASTLRNDKGD